MNDKIARPTFPTRDGMWQPPAILWKQMCAVYGGRLVEIECQNINLWLVKKPGQWKTARGMPRFLNTWFSRCKPIGATNGTNQPQRRQTRNDLILSEALASLDGKASQDNGGCDPDPFTIQ